MSKPRIIMLAKASDSTRLVYHKVSETFEIEKVILEQPVDKKKFLERRVKKLGYLTVVGQVLFQLIIVKWLKLVSQKRVQEICTGIQEKIIPRDKIILVRSINTEEARNAIKQLQPNIILVNGTRIISKKTIACSDAKMINTHVGITPLYRGVHGGYWALAQNDTANCGVTIHLIDAGIDTGGILAQAVINPSNKDNFYTYPFLQTLKGIDLIKQLIPKLEGDKIELISPPEGKSQLWYHPTLFQYLKNRIFHSIK